ncbi:unnamed protein product [Choristocarpus tenellus]
MTGTYAGQFVMEGFLRLKIARWQRVLLTRVIALGPALVVTIALRDDPTSTDRMSAWLNVLQSLQLPFAIIPLLTFCSSESIMGEFKIGWMTSVFVWVISIGVIGINIFIVGGFVIDSSDGTSYERMIWIYLGVVALSGLYLGFIVYLLKADLQWLYGKIRAVCGMPLEGWNGGSQGYGDQGFSRKVRVDVPHHLLPTDDGDDEQEKIVNGRDGWDAVKSSVVSGERGLMESKEENGQPNNSRPVLV